MENGEWKMAKGKRKMKNAKNGKMQNAKCKMEKWKMENGK